MSPDDVVALAVVMTGIVTIALGLPLVRAWTRRKEHVAPPSPESEARLRRMEAAVEAIAIEVERISEGQRFVTKLLAEREAPAAALNAAARDPRDPRDRA